MDIGLFMNTHGILTRHGGDAYIEVVPPDQMRPVQVAQLAERWGYHSLWFSDHVTVSIGPTAGHVANPETKTRAYPPQPNMLDGAVVMGAVAANTSRIRMAPSVLIAPYRGPLNDARQFATVDVLSNGRLILGVGAGWMKEEFDALGLPFEHRGEMTEECIEIYKRAWKDDAVSFHGKFYNFDNLSMDPKPVQRPRPPIVFGSVVAAGARRAARLTDGFFPIFVDTYPSPARFRSLQDLIRRELEALKKDPGEFAMLGPVSALVTSADDPLTRAQPRPICTGTPDQILEDLGRFAAEGYSLMILHIIAPGAKTDALLEQIEWFGREVLPAARKIPVAGEWKKDF